MQYLLLFCLIVITYTEIFPTISTLFEWVRSSVTLNILYIQKEIVAVQQEIEQMQTEQLPTNTTAIGFQDRCMEEEEEGVYYE